MSRASCTSGLRVPLAFLLFLACRREEPPKQASSGDDAAAFRPICRDSIDYRDTVTLTGQLTVHTYPGAPNFESIPAGDASERGFYLVLAAPICARSRGTAAANDGMHAERRDVRYVQLVLDSAGYARLRPSLGSNITVRGTTFASFTGHHHAPLLLQPVPHDLR